MKVVRVLETNILHGSSAIVWVDGTTADNAEDMLVVPTLLQVEVESPLPAGHRVVHTAGKTVVLVQHRQDLKGVVVGLASEEDKTLTAGSNYIIAGTVRDVTQRYTPRKFSIISGDGQRHRLPVYPSPLGIHFGPSGGVYGTVVFQQGGTAAAWAMPQLVVQVGVDANNQPLSKTFRCQCTGYGDFRMSLMGLPPLAPGQQDYDATLTIRASANSQKETPTDPDTLGAAEIESPSDAGSFLNDVSVKIVPGAVTRLSSSGGTALIIRTI